VKKGSRFNQRLTQLTGLVSQVNCNSLRDGPLLLLFCLLFGGRGEGRG